MWKAAAFLAVGVVCAPAFGASVTTTRTSDYGTGWATGSTWTYSPQELGLQPRDLSVPLAGTTPEQWQELLDLEGGVPYWMTGQESDILAWDLAESQGWTRDNFQGSDFNPTTGELKLFIMEWTGESPWDYQKRTGLSPWSDPVVTLNPDDGTWTLLRSDMAARSVAAVPSPSALAAGLAFVAAGAMRRRR